jgi:hypothetical protein
LIEESDLIRLGNNCLRQGCVSNVSKIPLWTVVKISATEATIEQNMNLRMLSTQAILNYVELSILE